MGHPSLFFLAIVYCYVLIVPALPTDTFFSASGDANRHGLLLLQTSFPMVRQNPTNHILVANPKWTTVTWQGVPVYHELSVGIAQVCSDLLIGGGHLTSGCRHSHPSPFSIFQAEVAMVFSCFFPTREKVKNQCDCEYRSMAFGVWGLNAYASAGSDVSIGRKNAGHNELAVTGRCNICILGARPKRKRTGVLYVPNNCAKHLNWSTCKLESRHAGNSPNPPCNALLWQCN
jgi:hypothetical protein